MKSSITKYLKSLLRINDEDTQETRMSDPVDAINFILMKNGDEVIARVYNTTDDNILCFENPLVIRRLENQNGFDINLNKWIPYTEDILLPVNRNSIVTKTTINSSLEEYYESIVYKIETNNEEHLNNNIQDKFLNDSKGPVTYH